MKKNSRVSVALHALAHLVKRQTPVTSRELGECLQSNPVVIRRVLGDLKKAGILDSGKGHGGGWSFATPPDQISFSDVLTALDEKLVPDAPQLDDDEQCVIMRALTLIMNDALTDAETFLDNRLKKISLYDVVNMERED